jgi:hypothetical protein
MESYFGFMKKFAASLGLNFDDEENRRFDSLKNITLAIIYTTTFQSFLFLMTAKEFDFLIASAFTIGFYDLQGCFKYTAILMNLQRFKEIRKIPDQMLSMMSKEQFTENITTLNFYRKLTKTLVVSNLSCIWMFNVLPMVTLLYFLVFKGILVQMVPFAFWYPFNKTEHYFPVYFYEVVSGHVLTAVPLACDGIFYLTVGQFVVLFKILGENFAKVINEFELAKRKETVEKVKKLIDLHNQLLDMSAEVFGFYSLPLLANVLSQALTICFISFIISVKNSIFKNILKHLS